MALNRVWIASPNYSSRGGTGVRLIVIHTAEGATTYQSLGNFFASSSSGVSSHTGIDDTSNTVGEYVRRSSKAWTQGNANPYSTATELCAFAAWTRADWDRHPVMLANCAKWIAEEAAHFGIPVVKLNASQAQGGQAGVCGHVDLGAAGGGHWDPGPDFPWTDVINMAKGGAAPAPPPPTVIPTKEDDDTMVISRTWNGTTQCFGVGPDGRLRQRWEVKNAKGQVDWASHVIANDCEPNQSPGADEHSGQLHLYAIREDSKWLRMAIQERSDVGDRGPGGLNLGPDRALITVLLIGLIVITFAAWLLR